MEIARTWRWSQNSCNEKNAKYEKAKHNFPGWIQKFSPAWASTWICRASKKSFRNSPVLVRCEREFQPLHLHILWIIPVKFCYNRTKKYFLKTKHYPMTSFTDLHISDLIKKLYVFHMSYLPFDLQTDTRSSQNDSCIFDFI